MTFEIKNVNLGFPLRIIFETEKQEVDLNCCYLGEERWGFHCKRDLDGEELISCVDCNGHAVYMNK
ncbi:MAG: hypothetical protein ACXAEU_16305 [Candidatus Hodarchaeales archaeon]|jgi:hypothetical protein